MDDVVDDALISTSTSASISAFSFMQQSSSTVSSDDSAASGSAETSISSGFSFMQLGAASATSITSPLPAAPTADSTQSFSGFSFLSSTPPPPAAVVAKEVKFSPVHDFHNNTNSSMVDTLQPHEIKLGKAAAVAPKAVKKKKRSSRVGFARNDGDDHDDGDDDMATVTATHTSLAQQPMLTSVDIIVSKSAAIETYTTNHIDAPVSVPEPPSLPPPPIPPFVPEEIKQKIYTPTPISQAAPTTPIPQQQQHSHDEDRRELAATTAIVEMPSDHKLGIHHTSPTLSTTSSTTATTIASSATATASAASTNSKSFSVSVHDDLYVASNEIVLSFTETATIFCQEFESINSDIKRCHADIEAYEEQVAVSLLSLSDLEAEQRRLADAEEFDLADALTAKIDVQRLEHNNKTVKLENEKLKLVKLCNDLTDNKNNQRDFIDSIRGHLCSLRVQQDESVSKSVALSLKQQKNEEDRLRVEEGRILLEMQSIERQEEACNEESKIINSAIEAASGDVLVCKAQLELQLVTLSEEIEELERVLLAKRAEERTCKLELQSATIKIEDVHRKYERQLLRITDTRRDVEANRLECIKEKCSVATERDNLLHSVEVSREVEGILHDWMSDVGNKIDITQMLYSTIFTDVIDAKAGCHADGTSTSSSSSSSSSSNSSSRHFQDLRNDVIEADTVYSSAVGELNDVEAKLHALGIEGKEIDEKLIRLDNDKKVYAAAKQFKEAANAAKEIKALQTRQEDIAVKVAAMTADIPIVAEKVRMSLDRKNECCRMLKNAQKDEDTVVYASLVKRASQLRHVRGQILSIAESDYGATLRDVSLMLLDAELASAMQNAAVLQEKHGLIEASVDAGTDSATTTDTDAVTVDDTCVPIDDVTVDATPPVEVIDTEEAVEAPVVTQEEVEEEDYDLLLSQAKEVSALVETLTARVEAACIDEDYESAAAIDEECNGHKDTLTSLLAKLSFTLEELKLL